MLKADVILIFIFNDYLIVTSRQYIWRFKMISTYSTIFRVNDFQKIQLIILCD